MIFLENSNFINEVIPFVKWAHGAQLRKYTDEPYWTHCLEVMNILCANSANLQCTLEDPAIALMHDILEDTRVKEEDIADFFDKLPSISNPRLEVSMEVSAHIINGVRALTDVYTSKAFPRWTRAKRKLYEASRLATLPGDWQTIKYADLISNTSSIVEHDKKFASYYLKEKEHLLSVMVDGDKILYEKAQATLEEAMCQLLF